jgi:hypothetical protein
MYQLYRAERVSWKHQGPSTSDDFTVVFFGRLKLHQYGIVERCPSSIIRANIPCAVDLPFNSTIGTRSPIDGKPVDCQPIAHLLSLLFCGLGLSDRA